MESKHMLMSAFGVGIGVGLGLGLASGSQNVSRLRGTVIYTGITPLMMEHEILGLVVNGRDSSVTFDQFPYYLRPWPNECRSHSRTLNILKKRIAASFSAEGSGMHGRIEAMEPVIWEGGLMKEQVSS